MKNLFLSFTLLFNLALINQAQGETSGINGFSDYGGELEAIGPETAVCSHCQAKCSTGDEGANRDDLSCAVLAERAKVLAGTAAAPKGVAAPLGKDKKIKD
jgi:hypothetical protein